MIEFIVLIVALCSTSMNAADLLVHDFSGEHKLNSKELLKHPKIESITLSLDPEYKKKMTYKALPISVLFESFKYSPVGFVEFKALDGYASAQSVARLLENKTARPYLAIEDSQKKWPQLPHKKMSAGPFFLIWVESDKSDVQIMEWPYAIMSLKFYDDLKIKYPKIYPLKELSADHQISKGFKVFLKNCFVCHTMNQEGDSQVGPDLNLPLNPTEYLSDKIIKKLIRNPQDLRYWPKSQMSSFPSELISDDELKDLLAYLRHMSDKKYPVTQK